VYALYIVYIAGVYALYIGVYICGVYIGVIPMVIPGVSYT